MGSPRDWMQTVKQTVDRIKAIIGNPDDTGGSETTGTVMGKENTIMKMLKDYDGKVKNNMILKQTPEQNFTMPSSKNLEIDFEFGKLVRIIGVYFTFASFPKSVSAPAYIINGENSFTTRFFADDNNGVAVFVRDNNGSLGFRIGISSSVQIISDIWATKLTFQLPPEIVEAGTTISAHAIYQEEG